MRVYLFGLALATAGAFVGIVGQFLPRDWLKPATTLLGVLLLIAAVSSAVVDATTSVLWAGKERIAQAANRSAPTPTTSPTPIPSLTPRPDLLAAGTATSDLSSAAETPEPSAATLELAEGTTIRIELTALPPAVLLPTRGPTPTNTPEPERWIIQLDQRADRIKALLVTNRKTEETWEPFQVGKSEKIYSAAWSPDGKQILVAYQWRSLNGDRLVGLRLMNADGSAGKEILALETSELPWEVGNAIWSPDGSQIALWLQNGTDDGVYLLDMEGNVPLDASSLLDSGALLRLENSVPGEWPRYWSVDGDWIITIASDQQLYALEVAGKRRVPLAELGPIEVFNQRHYPWRTTQNPVCEKPDRSWWRCR